MINKKIIRRNFCNKFVLLTLIAIFFLPLISCIGITPGRTSLNFEPGMSQDISFSVVNSEHKEMSVVISVRGDLADYITLKQTYGEFSKEEEIKSFTYSLNLPLKLAEPGLHDAEIVVLEMPKNIEEGGTSVGATVAVISQLHVYVPYPDKYVDAELNIDESDGKITFLIPVINRGKLDIVNLKADIDIYDGSDQKIDALETNTDSLLSLERKELSAVWDVSVNPGRYKAIVTIRYDNEIETILKEFNIGERFLEILEIVVNDFELGSIAKFNALVENKWSADLKDVYLNILVYNDEGEIMADFKSPTYDINALEKSEMVAYWDTAGVHKGTYDGNLILKYGEKTTERNIEMKITEYSIDVIGLTGRVSVKRGSSYNINNLLFILLGFLVIANIVWFVVVKRLIKRKK